MRGLSHLIVLFIFQTAQTANADEPVEIPDFQNTVKNLGETNRCDSVPAARTWCATAAKKYATLPSKNEQIELLKKNGFEHLKGTPFLYNCDYLVRIEGDDRFQFYPVRTSELCHAKARIHGDRGELSATGEINLQWTYTSTTRAEKLSSPTTYSPGPFFSESGAIDLLSAGPAEATRLPLTTPKKLKFEPDPKNPRLLIHSFTKKVPGDRGADYIILDARKSADIAIFAEGNPAFSASLQGYRIVGVERGDLVIADEVNISKIKGVWSRTASCLKVKSTEEIPPSRLKYYLTQMQHSKFSGPRMEGGFTIGGKNFSVKIKEQKTINGIDIQDLEGLMRPCESSSPAQRKRTDQKIGAKSKTPAFQFDCSQAGFIGPKESLLDLLSEDNSYVVDKLGITHQKIADELNKLASIAWALGRDGDLGFSNSMGMVSGRSPTPVEISYRNRRYALSAIQDGGCQASPFIEGDCTARTYEIMNLDTGKKISFSELLIPMIQKYGFYEGKGTPFRTSPQEILGVLDFLKP